MTDTGMNLDTKAHTQASRHSGLPLALQRTHPVPPVSQCSQPTRTLSFIIPESSLSCTLFILCPVPALVSSKLRDVPLSFSKSRSAGLMAIPGRTHHSLGVTIPHPDPCDHAHVTPLPLFMLFFSTYPQALKAVLCSVNQNKQGTVCVTLNYYFHLFNRNSF